MSTTTTPDDDQLISGVVEQPSFENAASANAPIASSSSINQQSSGQTTRKIRRTTRASRACLTCRKYKTRCLPTPNSRACLRCTTLGMDCSFMENADNDSMNSYQNSIYTILDPQSQYNSSAVVENRLQALEKNVAEILKILRNNNSNSAIATPSSNEGLDQGTSKPSDIAIPVTFDPSKNQQKDLPSFGLPSLPLVTSPFNSYGSLISPRNLPPPISRLFNPQMVVHDQDIISLGLISEEQAIAFLTHFRENYNRWVSFPEDVSIKVILDGIRRRCSLLLTVCCSISIRFLDQDLRAKIYKLLMQKLQAELNQSLLVVPQTIEFMQALAVISIYPAVLSDGEFIIDGWFYSSLALQHFITKDALGLVMSFDGIGPVTEFDEITAYRVWNHLCLVHLVNCILSGRMCILDETRFDLCRRTLDLSSATNFDGRMIAEITLQLIVYNFIEGDQSLSSVEEDLKLWKNEWGYLFEQPIIQFTESTYHYGCFLIVLNWMYVQQSSKMPSISITSVINGNNGSQIDQVLAACDKAVINNMVMHLIHVINGLLTVSDDSYFAHLSDQIHFCGAYSAIMLLRIIIVLTQFGRAHELAKDKAIDSLLGKANRLELKFRQVSTSEDDVVFKYAEGLAEMVAMI